MYDKKITKIKIFELNKSICLSQAELLVYVWYKIKIWIADTVR